MAGEGGIFLFVNPFVGKAFFVFGMGRFLKSSANILAITERKGSVCTDQET